MTSSPDDTTTDTSAIIAALRTERDAALAREAVLAEALTQCNSEYGERIEQQSATIDVLKVMSASPDDAKPVFELIAERAREFCEADKVAVALLEGDTLHLQAHTVFDEAFDRDYVGQFPRPLDTSSVFGRAIFAREAVQSLDLHLDPQHLSSQMSVMDLRSIAGVPIFREGRAIGAISLARRVPGPYSAAQVELLQTFAEQAVIAITSAETYRALQTRTSDLQESLEYQTATSDVLKVISGSDFELDPVFQAVVTTAARLCLADQATIYRYEDGEYGWAAGTSMPADYERIERSFRTGPGRGSLVGRVALEKSTVQILDAWNDPLYTLKDDARVGGVRTMLGVPLMRDGVPIGVIAVARYRVEPFTDKQIELVNTFADQAVIAIENTRLLTEQREALEQQTATADILRVINGSPGELTPVFDAILEKAHRICGATIGSLILYDGECLRAAATHGFADEFADQIRQPFRPAGRYQRLIDGERFVQAMPVDAISLRQAEVSGVRSTLAVPLRKDTVFLGAITAHRTDVRSFNEKEIVLLENFAAQAVIAMENARLIDEQREALEQQTATAEVLQVINSSPGNLAPVFDTMLEKAMRLCGAAFGSLYTYNGERFRTAAQCGVPPAYAEHRAITPPTARPGSPLERLVETKRAVHILDLAVDEGYLRGDAIGRALLDVGGARTALMVPLLKDESVVGAIVIYRQEVQAFSQKQIALVENFAAQAAIAIENARLLDEIRRRTNDLQQSLEYQTATSDVLKVISRSTFDLKPVLEALLSIAKRLCDADYAMVSQREASGFRALATQSASPEWAAALEGRLMLEDRSSVTGRAALAKRPVQIADAATDPDYALSGAVAVGHTRTCLGVPLLRDGVVVGAIALARTRVEPFTDRQIELVSTFADQAVIAIENTRLLTEQQEALEQRTATAEVLQVINANPGNLAPVFDTMLEKALTLCGAEHGSLGTYDGDYFRAVASRGYPAAVLETLQGGFHGLENPVTRPLFDGARFVQIPDLGEIDHPIPKAIAALGGFRTVLFVPLRKDGKLLGHISASRREVRSFAAKEIALLENFAAQAVIAMENARLLDEIRQRQAELRVTFENMGDGVAMFDETSSLVAWNQKFQDILDLPDGVLAEGLAFPDYIRYLTERGEYGEGAHPEEQIRRLTGQVGEVRAYERTRPDGRVIEIRRNPVPSGGFVLIFSDISERKRNEAEIRAARDAAEEASRTIEAAYRDLKAAQANLIQAEKMASLGQLTAGIAHEIKNPLNFVNNFSALSTELIDELRDVLAPEPLGETARTEVDDLTALLKGNLEKVVQHGQRADGIVRSMLDHSRGSSGERRMVDLNALIDEALNLAYHGARAQDQSFNITLERDFGERIAPIEVNPQDITRVLLNIFSNGFYATSKRARDGGDAGFEPTLKVTTRNAEEAVEIRVRDNGTGIPADIRDKLFQPFFTTKPTGEGTGLGLSITYDIVTQQHGGTIAVESEVGEYSEFTIRLPRNP